MSRSRTPSATAAVDLLLRVAPQSTHRQAAALPDPVERPARAARAVGWPGLVGHRPRSRPGAVRVTGQPPRAPSHSERAGRSIKRRRGRRGGEVSPATMAATCSAMGISTPSAPGQLDQRAGRLHALGHHVHPVEHLVEVRPWPSSKPTVRFRLRGLVHVATRSPTPASPPKVSGLTAEGDAEPTQLGQPPGDQHGPGVLAEPQPVADARGDGDDVLGGPGDLAAHDVGPGVDPEGRAVQVPLDLAGQRPRRCRATTVAAGWPSATSRARLGPLRTPIGWPGSTSAMISDIRRLLPHLDALGQADHGGARSEVRGHSLQRRARKPWEGTAIRTTSAAATASANDAVARRPRAA